MTNEHRARELISSWSILFSEDTDRLGYTPQKLASEIAQALSEKDAIISDMREALELAIAGLKDVSDWCEYHSGPTADKYLDALKAKETP